MKKSILILGLLLSVTLIKAQTAKNSFYIGAFGGGSNIFDSRYSGDNLSNTQTQYNFSFGINAGYFIKDNLSIGITGIYNSTLTIAPNPFPQESETVNWFAPIDLMLHVRKYYMFTPNFGIYPQLSGGLVTGTSRNMLRIDDELVLLAEADLTGYSANAGLGIVWFPTKKAKRLSIEAYINALKYQAVTSNYKSPSNRDNLLKTSFHFLQTSFGINYFIFKQPEAK